MGRRSRVVSQFLRFSGNASNEDGATGIMPALVADVNSVGMLGKLC